MDIPPFYKPNYKDMMEDESITTEKYEETEVTATLSNTLLDEINNVEDYLVKHHQFLSGIPCRVYVNYAKKTHTYTQRQRRIVKRAVDVKPKFYDENGKQYFTKDNKFLEEYLKYFYKQQSDNAKAKEDVKKAIEDFIDKNLMPKPEPEKLNPLKFFSPTDLT